MNRLRQTLRSCSEAVPDSVGGCMSQARARCLAAALHDRGLAAQAVKLGVGAYWVRVAPADLRRAEALAFAFAEGEAFARRASTW